MSIDNELRGRLALITGASGGIGSACAEKFVHRGVDLALTYSSNKQAVDELVLRLRGLQEAQPWLLPCKITVHKADLASVDETVKLCEDVQKEHGRAVDILVSNAGYGKRIQDIWDIPVEEFDYTLNVNLRASFLLVKGVVEGMKAQKWGRIIFVSSIAAYGVGLNGCHYAASKGGLTSMMKNLSTRLAEYNITVNDVSPAMIGGTGLIADEHAVPGLTDSIPLRRLGTPEECANVILMFSETGYATGQSFLLAGGINHK